MKTLLKMFLLVNKYMYLKVQLNYLNYLFIYLFSFTGKKIRRRKAKGKSYVKVTSCCHG